MMEGGIFKLKYISTYTVKLYITVCALKWKVSENIMKKNVLLFALLFLFFIPVKTNATTTRIVTIDPRLDFDGTTANCYVSIFDPSADIKATIKLWQGTSCIATWNAKGTGFVEFSDTVTVSKGKSYTLTVDAIIDGVAKPRQSCTGTC